ncbi:hypothetical protein GO003_002800 [Methylicorpusculum oleiharenae]|uniref:hypothetical protein n=1 Tax=Methylicorpusculum oleiharenae TaxID=1338687 RepID=UPI0013580AFB|nr:hypothetical protein [Methylicorpusculum oleiharenae]MCD2449317.1 hypothetical protein [Methylicorpusculum oleiharenae]
MNPADEKKYLEQLNVQREISINSVIAKTHPNKLMQTMESVRKKAMVPPPPPVMRLNEADLIPANAERMPLAEQLPNIRGNYRAHSEKMHIRGTELASNEQLRVHKPDGSTEIAPAGVNSVALAWLSYPDSNRIDRVKLNGKGIPVEVHKLKRRTTRG